MGDTGGASRLDGIFHPAICISKRKYGEKRNTKIHLADCEIYMKKVKMERKEIQLAKGAPMPTSPPPRDR